jgi:hypothetical protein
MTGATILLALALTEATMGPIRSDHPRVVKAIAEASRSVTFQRLVQRLSHADLIIYIESGRCA